MIFYSSKWKWILFFLFLFGVGFISGNFWQKHCAITYPDKVEGAQLPLIPYSPLKEKFDAAPNTGNWRDHYYQAIQTKDWLKAKEEYEIIVSDLFSNSIEDSPHMRGATQAAGELIRVYYYLGFEQKGEKLLIEFVDCCIDSLNSLIESLERNHKVFKYPSWSIVSPIQVSTIQISAKDETSSFYTPLVREWWLDPTVISNPDSWQRFYHFGAGADDWKTAGEYYEAVLTIAQKQGIQDLLQAKHTLMATAELIRIYYHLGLKKEADMLLKDFMNEYENINLGFMDSVFQNK